MANLKNLTVRYLRDLARKHLGRGHSKLKTKDELLAALRKVVPAFGKHDGEDELQTSSSMTQATPPAEVIHFDKPLAINGAVMAASSAPPAGGGGRGGGGSDGAGSGGGEGPRRDEGALPPVREVTPAEPLVEGFFVARIAGEREARSHHLTEDQAGTIHEHGEDLHFREDLPAIPDAYEDDRVVLLARDPHTAYLYWDLRPQTRHAAFEGLDAPRAVLRVLEEGREVKTLDVMLESRRFYVHGLTPGRPYRMELLAVGADGTSRRIAEASNTVVLPSDDVSGDHSVRFMRVPWNVPLRRLREGIQAGRVPVQSPETPPEPLQITYSKWVPLPNSGSWQLVSWTQTAPREGAGPEEAIPGFTPIAVGPFAVGGSSSWTLQSSWWSSPGGSSGVHASSRQR